MKAFKVIYKHGHFIDVETKQRLIPVQGEEYTITAADNSFKTEDAKMDIGEPRSAVEKALWAEGKFGSGNYAKLMSAGQQFFFRIGNSKTEEGDESYQYIFVCSLLEDLYLYLLKGKDGQEEGHWRLADCRCVLESCLLGGLTLTEKVPATSLNSLFSHTVQFYFSLQRSGTVNVFNAFFVYEPNMQITYDAISKQRYYSLAIARQEFIKKNRRPFTSLFTR